MWLVLCFCECCDLFFSFVVVDVFVCEGRMFVLGVAYGFWIVWGQSCVGSVLCGVSLVWVLAVLWEVLGVLCVEWGVMWYHCVVVL